MADVKSMLKEARKLIDEKNYKEAQDCCKKLLRQDKENYLGLVLLGKSLQNDEQAPLAFQKAISCKQDNPLAWQGLASYYENRATDDANTKILSIYGEMLKLKLEDDKLMEIISKIGSLGGSTKNPLAINTLINFIITNPKADLRKKASEAFIAVVKSGVSLDTTDIDAEIIVNVLNNIYEDDPGNSFIELTIAKTIASKKLTTEAIVQEIINLSYFTSNKSIREWLCKYLFANYMEKGANIMELERIIKDIEDYKYAGLLKSASLYEQGKYLDAFNVCVSIINYNQPEKHEAIFFIQCTVNLKKWTVVEKLSNNFLIRVTDKEFQKELRKYLFIALSKQLKWKEAYCVAVQGLEVKSMSNEQQALLAECYIELNQSVDEIMNNLINTEYYVQLSALRLLRKGEFRETITLLEDNLSKCNNGLIYYYLALAHWELKIYDKAHINLLKAANLYSDFPYIFLYLGHFYKNSNNFEKARKCYEKANNMLPFHDTIVMNLSEIYVKLGLENLHYELLISLENSELKQNVWVNYQMGIHYLNNRDWEKAIIKFRNVIKVIPKDATAFECLADAYYFRGSYTSALKAYNKTIALNPNKASHCLTNIGNIHKLLTQYSEAIETFMKVLKIDPESVLALKGISETWMKVAERKLTLNLFGSAQNSVQIAIDYIIKTINIGKQISSLYKMLGDALMFVTTLPSTYAFVDIQGLFHDANEQKKVHNLDIFTYAVACYTQVMKLRNETSSFDLAAAYLSWYKESRKQSHLQVALNLAIACVRKKYSNYQYWNLLAKIFYYAKKYHLAQHCFIKAILVTQKMPIAKVWCNLGTLYYKLNLNKSANFCYSRGQSALPSYPQSWIGQGLVAERLCEQEAMDLFRHASRLGFHCESALGYSDWVCRKLKKGNTNNPEFQYDIYGLHAIPYSADLMQWFCIFEENNACGHTILGILQERLGLLESAKQSYKKALQHANDNEKNIVLLNLGGVYLRLKEYEEALSAHRAITEASLYSLCGLALSLLKNGNYEEAYSAYQSALCWYTGTPNERLEIMVAMAGVMYLMKGPDEAKMLLFESIRASQNQPSPYCLFASCALGILHSDENLSKIALRVLQKHESDAKYASDIGFLKSYMCIYENRIEDAVRIISETINDFPNNASLWFYLAQYSHKLSKAKLASVCAQRAMSISSLKTVLNANSPKMFASASVCEFIAGNQSQAIQIAKKAMHMYPYESEVWAALIFSLLSMKSDKRHWLIAATSHLRKSSTNSNLSDWAGIVEKTLII